MIGYLPLITIIISGGLICRLFAGGLYKEQSHRFLLLFLAFSVAYATSDILFFNAPSPESARLIAKIDLTMVYLMAISMALLARSLENDIRWKHGILLVLPLVFSITIWIGLVESVRLRSWGWQVVYDMDLLMIWGLGILIPLLITPCSLWRTEKRLKLSNSSYEPRIKLILLGFTLFLLFGQVNLVGEAMLDVTPPLLSTLLSIPITIIAWTMRPHTE